MKDEDEAYVKSFTDTTKAIIGESEKIITSMQNEVAEKEKSTQMMIDEEARLLDYYSEARATKQEYLDLTRQRIRPDDIAPSKINSFNILFILQE